MKTKLIIGSLLTLIILVVVPSIPAIEFNIAVETNTMQLQKEMKNEQIFSTNTKKELTRQLNNYISQQHLQDQPFVALFWHIVQFVNKMITVCIIQPIQAIVIIMYIIL